MEVLVSDQGLGFKCVLEQKVEEDESVSTGNEHGGTLERNNASNEERYHAGHRGAVRFEPQTEAENDELIVQGLHVAQSTLTSTLVSVRIRGSSALHRRMPRSLTNGDDDGNRRVAEGPALDYQRAHDCRVAATAVAFFKLDANDRVARASTARSVA